MARNVKPVEEIEERPRSDKAQVPGGASGAPGEANPAEAAHAMMSLLNRGKPNPGAPAQPRAEEVKPRRYRVTGGPATKLGLPPGTFPVVYNGSITPVRPGKEFADNQVDIELLRRQGIQFEEIKDDAPVAG